jgi:hypothetical protein
VLWKLSGIKSAQTANTLNQLEHITVPSAINASSTWIIIAVSPLILSLFSLIAWVNNCLGLENYRYFLLFILYLLIALCYNLITIVSIWNHHIYRKNYAMMNFIAIMDFALIIVLIGFNLWNWFLAMTGMSTLEFWGLR